MERLLTAKTRLKFEDWAKIDEYLKEINAKNYFACFPNLLVVNTVPKKGLFFITWRGKKRIIFYNRRFWKDIRILFESRPEDSELVNVLWKQLKPDHIGYSFVDSIPNGAKVFLEDFEFVHNLKCVAEMKGKLWKKVRKNCNTFIKANPAIKVVEATKNHKRAIFKFFREWAKFATKYFGYRVDMKEDIAFVKVFLGNSRTPGTLFIDGEKIIGIEFHTHCPSDRSIAIGLIKKNIRGYKCLGEFITKIQAYKTLSEGYMEKNVYSGGKIGEVDFKKKFMCGGRTLSQCHYSIKSGAKLKEKTNFDKCFFKQVFFV
ncbi:MAG: hypothetical protein CVU81_02855 [Euryarchaeota archaeon HGW-Euryarchaeota-1]|nr:MAG: hypothetical protein CVU81_02855 [Euryarchaeota archaeon HGW-Euryarchaeota-1]